jgi:hypothetical protein
MEWLVPAKNALRGFLKGHDAQKSGQGAAPFYFALEETLGLRQGSYKIQQNHSSNAAIWQKLVKPNCDFLYTVGTDT